MAAVTQRLQSAALAVQRGARASSSLTRSAGVLEQFREKPKPVRSPAVREAEGPQIAQTTIVYEPKAVLDFPTVKEAAITSDVQEQFSGRTVTIHKTGKISQSSNVVGTTHYTLEFDATADWTNTLMGWNGVADTMDQLRNRFRFETPAEAIYFCETNGWKWELIQDRQETPEDEDDNLYDYNFLPRRHKMSLAELGPRKGKRQWTHSKAGTAGWANLKRSQYGLEAWQAKPAKKAQ